MDEKFQYAVGKVLDHEGGYVNDPRDAGGETNFGISKRSYPDPDIKHLTRKQAIGIYRRDWWERYGYERIVDPLLAAKVLDLAVNMGTRRAHKLLQQALVRCGHPEIQVDGILGPKTIAAVNGHEQPGLLLGVFKGLAVDYYLSLNRPEYIKGWTRRALS